MQLIIPQTAAATQQALGIITMINNAVAGFAHNLSTITTQLSVGIPSKNISGADLQASLGSVNIEKINTLSIALSSI